jgi:hypothetical protein
MAHDVFISHSAKNKIIADAVCATLEANGIRCWIAPRDVIPSLEWGASIVEGIENSRIMVLVFTADANASPQISREVERAVNRGVPILPLRVEDVVPGKGLEYFIGNLHWMDALTPPLETHLKNLADTVKMLLARPDTREAAPIRPSVDAAARVEAGEPTKVVGRSAEAAPQTFAPARETGFRGASAESKVPAPRRTWKWIWIGIGVAAIAWLAWFLFHVQGGPPAEVRNSPRLELSLVANDATKGVGPPLHDYSDPNKTYGIEKDLTLPGDIDRVSGGKDSEGRPVLDIQLSPAGGAKLIKSTNELIGRQIALVLDGRTVLSVALVQSGLGDRIEMTGNFTSEDITRMLDAISPRNPQ